MVENIRKNLKVVHYINQFFAGIGGEEKAHEGLSQKAGPIGPGVQLQEALQGEGTVVATLFCGDDYFVENQEEVLRQAIKLIDGIKPDLLIAGPAFNAGRYGQACGAICCTVQEELGIPTITGMYSENPAVELYRKVVYIIETPSRIGRIPELFKKMVHLGIRLAKVESIGPAADEGYFSKGVRKNVFVKSTGAERAVDMLLKKMEAQPFTTEIQAPVYDTVLPAPPIKDLSQAIIAMVTDGGIVPIGNPDGIRGCAANNPLGKYSIKGLDDLRQETFECIHRGIDHRTASADPDRFVPLDVMRNLEREGKIGHLYEWLNSTSGCNMEFDNAVRIGQEIAKDVLNNGVAGVILTSA